MSFSKHEGVFLFGHEKNVGTLRYAPNDGGICSHGYQPRRDAMSQPKNDLIMKTFSQTIILNPAKDRSICIYETPYKSKKRKKKLQSGVVLGAELK